MNSIEAERDLILDHIITQDQRDQAAADVLSVSEASWRSARLSLQLQDDLDGELSKAAIRMAVGYLYHCAAGTIRRREKAAKMVSPELVNEYPDITFSYWRTACDAHHIPDQAAAMLEVIGWILDYKDDPGRGNGKLPTVDVVEGWVYGESGPAAFAWQSRAEGVVDQLDKIRADTHAPIEIRDLSSWVRGVLQSYLDTGISPIMPPQLSENKTKQEGGAIM